MQIYKFRDCLFNTVERAVIKGDRLVDLTTKTFDVLQYLIENSGSIVTKDEILGKVWNGNFVEESNLPVHVSKLRRSLGETRISRFIETVQGVGYRFVAPVNRIDVSEWQRAFDRVELLETVRPRVAGEADFLASVAVLPFLNKSGNSSLDYMADGLTESITNKLALIPNVKVLARSSVVRYRQNNVNAKDVGETLGLSAVLAGEVSLAGDDLLVSADLVRVCDGTVVWSTRLRQPPSSIIKIVSAIASTVAAFVDGSSDGDMPLSYLGTRDADSYREYLRGKYFLEKRTVDMIRKGIEYFHESIKKDPGNIYPYIALVDSVRILYSFDAISYCDVVPQIKRYLAAIAEFDQDIAELQLTYAEVKLQLEWDVKAAERHVRNALALNPNFVSAYYRNIELLTIQQRPDEAVTQIQKVLELDPLSLLTYKRVGRSFYCLGRFDDALEYLADARELEPLDYETLALIGAVFAEMGKHHEALEVFEESMRSNPTAEVLSMIGYVQSLVGRHDAALETVSKLEIEYNGSKEHPLMLARIYQAIGDKEAAYHLLDQAFEQHEIDLYGIAWDPRWKLMRNDERFIRLVERIGIVAAPTHST